MGFEGRVCASKWLKRIWSRSLLVIEEEDGTPCIGSVRARASKVNMSSYWKERDGWRAKDGLDQKWTGTNMAMAPSLLRRNGGLEDCATMLRLSAGKRWEYSRHNVILCKACSGNMRGLRHPLLKCYHPARNCPRRVEEVLLQIHKQGETGAPEASNDRDLQPYDIDRGW